MSYNELMKQGEISRKKVFLPKWQRWFLMPLFGGIWGLITYLEFFGSDNEEKMGWVGYWLFSGIFLGLVVMMWLMTSGRLPAYVIEEDRKQKGKRK